MATISEVARLAGVSSATVSHVMNKTRKVNPETVERVESAIRELDYRPNAQARSLKTGLSRQVGVINLSSIDPYFSEVLLGIERVANAQGYAVLMEHSGYDERQQMVNLNLLLENGVDGVIINSPMVTDEFYALLRKLTIPCVMLQFYDETLPVDFIHTDDLNAAYQATAYLLDLNHTRVACIAGWANPEHSAYQRRAGYQKALLERGLPIRKDYFVVSQYSIEEGYNYFKQLRALPESPTALITYSDLLALGVLRAAADMGLSVPGDVSVIGFDDIELASYTVPRLTTVYQEKAVMGQMAFERLHQRIQNPGLPLERKVLPTHLVVRESCGLLRVP